MHRPKHCWPLHVLERFSANSGCCWVLLTGVEPGESSPSGRHVPGGGGRPQHSSREEPGARDPWGPQDTAAQGHGGSPSPPLPGTHTCRGTKAEPFPEDGEPEAEAQPVRMKRTPLSPRRRVRGDSVPGDRQEGRPAPSPGASEGDRRPGAVLGGCPRHPQERGAAGPEEQGQHGGCKAETGPG